MDMFRYEAFIVRRFTLCHGRGYYQGLRVAQGMSELGGLCGNR